MLCTSDQNQASLNWTTAIPISVYKCLTFTLACLSSLDICSASWGDVDPHPATVACVPLSYHLSSAGETAIRIVGWDDSRGRYNNARSAPEMWNHCLK